MPPSSRSWRQTCRRLTTVLATVASLALAGEPARATSAKDVEDLLLLIKKSGTEIVVVDCKEGLKGTYAFGENPKIDRLTICKNNVKLNDPDDVWEVIAHEATHIMQACVGDHLFKDEFHPRIVRDLQAKAHHYSVIIEQQYRGAEMMRESEAYFMELQTPEDVKEIFIKACLTPRQPNAANP
ncbi:MAG: hypothetical protein ACK5QW_11145 [Cyanobacteriota bacterium]|jgi:hypothetical protein